MLGTIVNFAAIAVGASLGLFFRKGIRDRYRRIMLQGAGLAVLLIGMKMAFEADNVLVIIISLISGGLLGELLQLDKKLDSLASKLEAKLKMPGDGRFVEGFVSATLIYCVGAMAIVGAIESGISGNHSILFAKSALDGITAVVFASAMGSGVLLSAFSVLIYQGLLTLLATSVSSYLSMEVVAYMSSVGGLLIVAIALDVLEIKKINTANLLPSVFTAVAAAGIYLKIFIGG